MAQRMLTGAECLGIQGMPVSDLPKHCRDCEGNKKASMAGDAVNQFELVAYYVALLSTVDL